MAPAQLRDRLAMDPAAAALRLADDPPDLPALWATLTQILGTDEVDVVDLRRTSALLRYRAARDGIPVLERPAGEFQRFQLQAVQVWCDTESVIRSAHDDVLAALG